METVKQIIFLLLIVGVSIILFAGCKYNTTTIAQTNKNRKSDN